MGRFRSRLRDEARAFPLGGLPARFRDLARDELHGQDPRLVALAMDGGPFRGQRYIVGATERRVVLIPVNSMLQPVGTPIQGGRTEFSVRRFRRSKLTALGGCELTLLSPGGASLRLTFPRPWRSEGLMLHEALSSGVV